MAHEFAKSFYNSREWQRVRAYCLMRDKYLCQDCGRPAEEVHHKEHLTPQNIDDVNVSLNPENLVCLCRDCHLARHKGEQNVLPKIVFDKSGNAVVSPRIEIS